METLFGIPIGTLTTVLTIIFVLSALVTSIMAIRNPIVLKMALRNIPRRRAQTVLIVLGLMLATLLFSASFATGDTLSNSIRVQAVSAIGEIDEIVKSEDREPSGRPKFLDVKAFVEVENALRNSQVDGIVPIIELETTAVSVTTKRSEPRLSVLGVDPEKVAGFDRILGVNFDLLSPGQIFLSVEEANELDIVKGQKLALYFSPEPSIVEVFDIYDNGASGALLRLEDFQEILSKPEMINGIYISNTGNAVGGAKFSDEVETDLKQVTEDIGLSVDTVKKDTLEIADQVGGSLASIFLLFGSFSIIAGILLISLIFVMLAAERKRELGIARAVGAQRNHIVRLFTFEGAIYSLVAAAIGCLLGVLVGLVMVQVIGVALGSTEEFKLEIAFSFRWQSMVLAYTLGMVVTFGVVVISAIKVSSLNIVRAVRDIPEPPSEVVRLNLLIKQIAVVIAQTIRSFASLKIKRAIKLLFLSIPRSLIKFLWAAFLTGYLMILLGIPQVFSGISSEQLTLFLLGLSLTIIGIPLVIRHLFGLSERLAYSIAGALLVILWIVPWDWESFGLPNFDAGVEIFVTSGVTIVVGAVWVVIYNSDYIVNLISRAIGQGRTLAPIVRTATAYPMSSRLRTGMTLAMFSLVIFTLMVVGFINAAFAGAFNDTKRISGGFDITSSVNFSNPIDDFPEEIDQADSLNLDEFLAIGQLSGLPVKIRQSQTEQDFQDWFVTGIDAGYAEYVTYGFTLRDAQYKTDRDVWNALIEDESLAVVSSRIVASGAPEGFREVSDFELENIQRTDSEMPEVFIEIEGPTGAQSKKLKVIGVVEEQAVFARSVIISQTSLQKLSPVPLPVLWYEIALKDPLIAIQTATALEEVFVENGLQAQSLEKLVKEQNAISLTFNKLIQGFMGLGLVVGIAALGVIAARSVVERRLQIGVLRAIGFRKEMVQLSFLIESSFIALLGIVVGLSLGFGLSYGIVSNIGEEIPGVSYRIPWSTVIGVTVVAYGASLLMTFIPARQASKIYPAEALRFDE